MYKIAYATGSRADYGIVRRYLKLLNDDKDIDFSILVTGSHLEEKFGKSVENIIADGFQIDFEAPLHIDNSTTSGVIQSMSVALDSFGTYFQKTKYDLLIILGDRYEMMAVATAAAMQRISILHLHGGEATYGNYDEFIRHCITKMSTFHFASTEAYRRRIIQLGERPDRVFNMGALGAENCQMIDETHVDLYVKNLPNKRYYVIVFHPETLTDNAPQEQVQEVLKALEQVKDYDFVFLGTNADTGSDAIRNKWVAYANSHKNCHYFENLNNDSYLYLIKHSIALVGNSSSGIIEAPSLGVCTVNIGHRQDGRISGNSVFHTECRSERILDCIKIATGFESKLIDNPYYCPNTAKQYYEKTKEIVNHKYFIVKSFYDFTIK